MARTTKPDEAVEVPNGESIYTIEELTKAHKALGAPYEIVAVALRLSGKETATEAEAKSIIQKFMKQEVK